jgi:hypothetical protein
MVGQGLEEARRHYKLPFGGPQEGFHEALRKIAPHFPAVEPHVGEKPGAYTRLPLNRLKKGLDAFRFKTPSGGKTWKMEWEFVRDVEGLTGRREPTNWYIMAREGKVAGFKDFKSDSDYQEKGAGLPRRNTRVTQDLSGLKAESEYIIWFLWAREIESQVEMHVRIRLARE